MQCVFAVAGGAPAYVFSYVASPFWFAVARARGDGDTVFNSSSGPLVFKVWIEELTAQLPGHRTGTLRLQLSASSRFVSAICFQRHPAPTD